MKHLLGTLTEKWMWAVMSRCLWKTSFLILHKFFDPNKPRHFMEINCRRRLCGNTEWLTRGGSINEVTVRWKAVLGDRGKFTESWGILRQKRKSAGKMVNLTIFSYLCSKKEKNGKFYWFYNQNVKLWEFDLKKFDQSIYKKT